MQVPALERHKEYVKHVHEYSTLPPIWESCATKRHLNKLKKNYCKHLKSIYLVQRTRNNNMYLPRKLRTVSDSLFKIQTELIKNLVLLSTTSIKTWLAEFSVKILLMSKENKVLCKCQNCAPSWLPLSLTFYLKVKW